MPDNNAVRPRSPFFRYRTERRRSQEQMATEIGVSVTMWGKWENGEYLPNDPNLRTISRVCGRRLLAAQLLWFFDFTREDCEPYFRSLDVRDSEGS